MKRGYISILFQLLAMSDWYNVSENIDIAKGKYKYPKTFKELKNNLKRTKIIKQNGY